MSLVTGTGAMLGNVGPVTGIEGGVVEKRSKEDCQQGRGQERRSSPWWLSHPRETEVSSVESG